MTRTAYITLIVLIVSAMSSCRTVKYVPVESIVRDSIYINNTQYDSIYQRDSVYILDKGDTVTIYKDKYITKYKYITDTIIIKSKTDSIQVPVPAEKELTRWQSFKMSVGGYALFAAVLLLGVFIYRLVKLRL